MTEIGGHACCKEIDLCNKELDPVLWDYRKPGNPVLYDEEGLKHNFSEVCFSSGFFLKTTNIQEVLKSSY